MFKKRRTLSFDADLRVSFMCFIYVFNDLFAADAIHKSKSTHIAGNRPILASVCDLLWSTT